MNTFVSFGFLHMYIFKTSSSFHPTYKEIGRKSLMENELKHDSHPTLTKEPGVFRMSYRKLFGLATERNVAVYVSKGKKKGTWSPDIILEGRLFNPPVWSQSR